MTDDVPSAARIQAMQMQRAANMEEAAAYYVEVDASEESYLGAMDAAFNPMVMARRFETLESRIKRRGKEEESQEQLEKAEKNILEVQKLEEVSDQYSEKNPELQQRTLLLLRSRINRHDTKEEILRKVLETYPDYFLADEALDFLIETTESDLAKTIKEAKDDLNANYSREIKAGRNISAQAREFSNQGLGSPTGLRNMYRDITGNPRDSSALFDELSNNFSFDKLKAVIDFMLHSLGNDLKSKGPSISRGELHRLMTETRSLQAILGIYRFFKSRMRLINSAFMRYSLTLPPRVNFESLAKQFVKFLNERYPTTEKILQMAMDFGIITELEAQIIIFAQMRDALRQVAPRLFRNERHRLDLLKIYIDALDQLEEKIEEEEEEEKEEQEQREKEQEKEKE